MYSDGFLDEEKVDVQGSCAREQYKSEWFMVEEKLKVNFFLKSADEGRSCCNWAHLVMRVFFDLSFGIDFNEVFKNLLCLSWKHKEAESFRLKEEM